MNWEAIAAIGQMLGSVAVFVTLGYLAVQVKHARSEARRALSQVRNDALRELLVQGRDERVNHLSVKAGSALGAEPYPFVAALIEKGLTREEATIVGSYQTSWWNHRLQIIPVVDELSAIERTIFDQGIRINYGQPGVPRLYYECIKPTAPPDAVRYIDSVLAQPG